jgi:Flp pilus assembly protein TadD
MERDHPPPAAFEFYVKGLLAQSSAARIGHLTEALRIAPAFQRPRVALWAVHQDDGEYQRALGVVSAVPATHRLSRQARFLSAISLLELGRHQEAHDRLTALNRDASDPALLNNLGVVQVRRPAGAAGGRASAWFADAMTLNPADPDLAFNYGYAAWVERNMATAMSALREVVRRDPTDAEAHYVLGLALQASGASAEGARERDLGKRLSATLAEFDARQGPVAQAPRGLERLKREIDVPAGWRVDDLMVAAGQRDQRDQARFHLEAGQRLFAAQRDAEAAVELRRAVYLSPYDSEAHLLLGRIHLRAARLQDAVDAFKIAIWSDDTPAARVALAEAFLALNDAASARSELEAALRRDANHAEATRLLNGLSR